MKKKKQTQQQPVSIKEKAISADHDHYSDRIRYGGLCFILLITFIIYLPVLHNSLLAWDDDGYITKNPLIHSIDLKELFTQNVKSNYHPLTMLVLAMEYHFFGLNETAYHAINLLLHLINVILVFYAIWFLSKNTIIGLIAALFFGIHPLHVESVAWASELKDLLYSGFFLAAYIYFLKFQKNQHYRYYFFSVVLFLAALLSKAMAASLPVILLLTDYFMGRKINAKVLIEKIPFFILAFIFGIIAVQAQKSTGATEMVIFPFVQRLIFASFGFITYLIKFIAPFGLSAFYPYPVKPGEAIPTVYFLYSLLLLGLIIFILYSVRRHKIFAFGFGFFAASVFLVLQILPVGAAMMADRYSYIPSIGIFFIAGTGIYRLWSKNIKWLAGLAMIFFTVLFSVQAHERCKIWKSDWILWNDVIKQYQNASVAFHNRGVIFYHEKKLNQALEDYNKAIALNPNDAETFDNRGLVYLDQNNENEALKDFNKSIQLNQNNFQAFLNRGCVYMNVNQSEKAFVDFNKSIELNPDYERSYNNRGCIYFNDKKYEEAIQDYNKAIQLNPNYAEAFYNRGLAEYRLGKKDIACKDFNISASMKYQKAVNEMGSICR